MSWSTSSFEPSISIPLVIVTATYLHGFLMLRRAGARRALRPRHALLFVAGSITLAAALLGPLDTVSEQLFSAHMIQHELLMTVAAPLMVLGKPGLAFVWAVRGKARRALATAIRRPAVRGAWRVVTRPFDAWLIHGVVIWVWHLPSLFDLALRNDGVHALQHLSFLGSALLFWWTVLYPRRRAERGVAVIALFTTAVHTGALGALIALSRTPWYSGYASTTLVWGITPLSDQQLAGLIMWIPASLAYLAGALFIVRRWLSDSDRGLATANQRRPFEAPPVSALIEESS
ncbi:MAG TPA: cytochrome c oxidase assembly protein [Gemmatimonadaceae bacterium]|nr:cytochrome c oxidase assembly protein [Gemmatimonadaceae bacterium]